MSSTGVRILTVDDSPSMRAMVTLTLHSAGLDVAQAEDGQAALGMAQREQFSLLLIDVNMPRLDGLTLVKTLRTLPAYRFTPMLILTTEASLERKQHGIAAGATGWLVKPFSPERLIATVRRLLV